MLIEKAGDRLTLTANDIEMQIRTTTVVDTGEDVRITVAARKFQDILRALPNSEVSLSLDESRLSVRAGRSRFQLQTLPADDYPLIELPTNNTARFSVSQRELKRLFGLVSYAMAQQDIRYYLNGLLLIADGRKLIFVATDGHRLAYSETDMVESVEQRHEIIIPRKAVSELARQITESDDPVDVIIASNQAVFRFGSV